jgi:cytidine deaminase
MEPSRLIEEAQKVAGEFILSDKHFSAGSVGAALVTISGRIYTGICIDLACGIGFCAEHSAIAEMLKSRETGIEMIVATDGKHILPPCGRCREMIFQIDNNNSATKVILSPDRIETLGRLLPDPWIPKHRVEKKSPKAG